jgi:hypothetical protein
MAREPIFLLPPPEDLAKLTDSTAAKSLEVIDNANRLGHSYASLAMACGTFGLIACIVAFTYLVVNGHPTAAGLVLGTSVLTILGQIVNSRLN